MSPWLREPLALGLDAGALAAAGTVVAAADGAWTLGTLSLAFTAVRERHPGARAARLLLAPDVCRHFVLSPPGGLRAFSELRGLAAARAAQLFGDGAWAAVADWQLARPFACAALPQALLDALLAASHEAGLALGLESAVLAALQAATPAPGFVAFATPAHVVLAHADGAGTHTLRALRRPVGEGDSLQAFATREATRESLRSGAAATPPQWLEPLPVVGDESEAAWASRLAARGGR